MSLNEMENRLRRLRGIEKKEEEKSERIRRILWIEIPLFIIEIIYIPVAVTLVVSWISSGQILWQIAFMLSILFNALSAII